MKVEKSHEAKVTFKDSQGHTYVIIKKSSDQSLMKLSGGKCSDIFNLPSKKADIEEFIKALRSIVEEDVSLHSYEI